MFFVYYAKVAKYELENKYLQKEKIFSDTQILKREDTGIIVFKDGKFIELIYDVSGKMDGRPGNSASRNGRSKTPFFANV
ncbi:hypothetical protein IMZ17_05295 [Geobacillus stearothermophilus]|nr:hypothetical protein IMZ17_05295 [Geobacillus stearothermophilus]